MSCKGCQAHWTGLKIAHCASCHETFTTPANFDKHRVRGKCVDPSIHLVKNARGIWHKPYEREDDDV